MPLRVVSRFLLRAPLLPLSVLAQDSRARTREVSRHDLFAAGLELGAPALLRGDGHAARGRPDAVHDRLARAKASVGRALDNYARRAAFRPTPHGLWAGVAMGTLGPRTQIATGPMHAHMTLSWARLFALGRALLADSEIRSGTRLRVAPSVFRGENQVTWLPFGSSSGQDGESREGQAELDLALTVVLDACASYRAWPEVRQALGHALGHARGHSLGHSLGHALGHALDHSLDQGAGRLGSGELDELDEYLLVLVDDGLLVHDLVPPLVGPPPLEWMRKRLEGRVPALEDAVDVLRDPLRSPRAKLAALGPREFAPQDVHAVLVHEPQHAVLSTVAVARAAKLAGLLFRMQEALVPPARELFLDPALSEALDATTEIFGAGALELNALAHGEYGTPLTTEERRPEAAAPTTLHAFLFHRLINRLVSRHRSAAGTDELRLSSDELLEVTPPADTPPTFELFLTPCREPRGALPGTGWLLGVHAPAGATWGRFAEALGENLGHALGELVAHEREARPGETRLDLSYAPSPALADLATHRPVRAKTLALSTFCAQGDVVPAEILLVSNAGARENLALRHGTLPIAPSALSRLRSTTAPAGAYRLLLGFSLYRQHAPWALTLGPLFTQAFANLPRVSIDGFVVMPRSFALPADLRRRALDRWRRNAAVPRWIQVGHEDELLLVDLDDPHASDHLVRLSAEERPRAWEVWPPLDAAVVDKGGRRVEAVVAVVDVPEGALAERASRATAATAAAGIVPPPRTKPARSAWRTFKLFGAADRADRVIDGVIGQVARQGLLAREIDAWFFLRYIDGPGRRDHLRFRAHAARRGGLVALERRLDAQLKWARRSGDVVHMETSEYHRELSRYGGEKVMGIVEQMFQSESELVCELLAFAGEPPDLTEQCVLALDALATGLGLGLVERLELASRRRVAHGEPDDEGISDEFRQRQARLHALLSTPPEPFLAHIARLAALPSHPDILPALLHLSANRVAGTDPEDEARAIYFWQRSLEGLVTRSRAPQRSPAPNRRT